MSAQSKEVTAVDVAQVAAFRWGLTLGPLRILRVGSNQVLTDGIVVLRIARHSDWFQFALSHEVCRRAAGLGLPVLPPLAGTDVYDDGEWIVTAWPYVECLAQPLTDWRWFGEATRALHDATPEIIDGLDIPTGVYSSRFLKRVQVRLETFSEDEALYPNQLDRLRSLHADIKVAIAHSKSTAAPVLIHADLHQGNVLNVPGGPLLIDFDTIQLDSAVIDAAATAVHARRFDPYSCIEPEFIKGYGIPLDKADGYEAYVALKMLGAATWIGTQATRSPAHAYEWEKRLSWYLGGSSEPWRVL